MNKEQKIILYSETFKGYARLRQIKKGNEVTGLEIKFTQDKEAATTFSNENAKDHFLKNYAIGINYQFRIEYLTEIL